jgi:hypothetical protein
LGSDSLVKCQMGSDSVEASGDGRAVARPRRNRHVLWCRTRLRPLPAPRLAMASRYARERGGPAPIRRGPALVLAHVSSGRERGLHGLAK